MIVVGIIFIILGVASCIYGNPMNNDVEIQIQTLFDFGVANSGSGFITIGAALAFIGVIIVTVRCIRRWHSDS